MENKVKVGIVGATGYAGVELVRLLLNHPYTEIVGISSVSFGGRDISEIYPGLRPEFQKELSSDPQQFLKGCDVVFASLPHGLSEGIALACMENDVLFIDLGADFRLDSENDYRKWYGKPFDYPKLHTQSVYGLCEWFREDIKKAKLVGNPGCYPTSIALGLWPALKKGLIQPKGIIIDSKSGVTGAGRSLTQNTHYPECNEALAAYKAGAHRHLPEIEQTLSKAGSGDVQVTFLPHLVPVNRGILSTIYCDCPADMETVRAAYEEAYGAERFVTVLREGEYANIRNVRCSNSCHISLHRDEHSGKLIVCSAIDNMVKGAAGQAVQNMNLILGLEEDCGLTAVAPAF
ncbi:MAG: N-acetyl-gamma-glutamyl-phosphate reductase [Anaerovoracaceae bacterium]|nr:N-acetyl-gamma-glutamyl-phosphate reductase [Bacillota bacterium]MDY3954563.1 N-acetyl-gamma-glutamyl-phosphate reductase [Anaerovoracaceae bacterium]